MLEYIFWDNPVVWNIVEKILVYRGVIILNKHEDQRCLHRVRQCNKIGVCRTPISHLPPIASRKPLKPGDGRAVYW